MAAPRKFTDAQREALFRLHAAGMSSREIAEAAEKGGTGLAPFTISSRTVRDIAGKMATETERRLPTPVIELESAEAMERAPARAARIVEAELTRLEDKQTRSGLTEKEIDRLPKLATYGERIERILKRQGQQQKRRTSAEKRAESVASQESGLVRMAREGREAAGEGDPPSSTRTCHDDDSSAESAVPPPLPTTEPTPGEQAAEETAPPSPSVIDAALARGTPAERAEVALKARAALVGVD